jgi:predicted CoA-binding protein
MRNVISSSETGSPGLAKPVVPGRIRYGPGARRRLEAVSAEHHGAPFQGPRTAFLVKIYRGFRSMDERHAERDRIAALLDLQEGRSDVALLDDAGIAALLRSKPRIAVVGASSSPFRPSNGVFQDLRRLGYDVVPVNPAETEVAGQACYPTLAAAVEATGPIDLVDVFRRPDACPAHATEAVAVGARCLWLQLGIVSPEAAAIAAAGGLSVVMDRCTAIEHARLIGG